jgi:hypothetical protein
VLVAWTHPAIQTVKVCVVPETALFPEPGEPAQPGHTVVVMMKPEGIVFVLTGVGIPVDTCTTVTGIVVVPQVWAHRARLMVYVVV